jgi:hypothetical protein
VASRGRRSENRKDRETLAARSASGRSSSHLLSLMVRIELWIVFVSQTTSLSVIPSLSPPCTILFRFL